MKVRVISLTSSFITYSTGINIGRHIFAKYKQFWKLCLVTCTWNRRMTISQECHYKHFMGSLLSKKTTSSSNVASERRKGMQTTRKSQSVKVIKWRLMNVFRNVAPVVFNSTLSGTLSAMTGIQPLFYKQASHPFEYHQFLDLCFQYFPVLHMLINVYTFSLDIIQIPAI